MRESARVRILLWGRVNAGKSTLFNALAGRGAALTSPEAGTTRDPVRASVRWEGLPEFELLDLAGQRASSDPVERAAAELAEVALEEGDAILYLLDATRPARELQEEWEQLPGEKRRRAWPILNKQDCTGTAASGSVPGSISCSARTGEGLERVRETIEEYLRQGEWTSRGARYIFTTRQVEHIRACAGELGRLIGEIATGEHAGEGEGDSTPELIVIDLRQAHSHLEEITGAISTEDTLDRIFHRFCLGK